MQVFLQKSILSKKAKFKINRVKRLKFILHIFNTPYKQGRQFFIN